MNENKLNNSDRPFMAQALKLAACGLYTTYPNPAVGCVFVRNGKIIGQGYHHKAGQPHAEIMALKDANYDVKGATCYVTLEPCSHYGRTPPCAKTLANAGIARCVIATGDPNPKVSGRGIAILKEAGIKVTLSVLEDKARFLNRAFMKGITHKMPYVSLKSGMSTDAKTALADGQSKWITGEKSRSCVQNIRAKCDVIITGSGTVIADNPSLSVRYNELPKKARKILSLEDVRQPLKVILDSKERLVCSSFKLFSEGLNLWVTASKDGCLHEEIINEHITRLYVPLDETDHVSIKKVLEYLGEKSYRHVLVEAGSILSSAFVNQNLVDDFYFFIAPKILGKSAKSALSLNDPLCLDDSFKYKIKKVKKYGDDVMIHGVVKEY